MPGQQRFMFGPSFLDDHAGQIISDVRVALVELISNSWDAYASNVAIKWPSEHVDSFEIVDDGHGMTPEEFARRWCTLGYQRLTEQGPWAQNFDRGPTNRRAFGRSGKGRHAAFSFGDEYLIETWRDGFKTGARVRRSASLLSPFEIEELPVERAAGHGTRILVPQPRPTRLAPEEVLEIVGGRFLLDPGFLVTINGMKVTLTELSDIVSSSRVEVEDVGGFLVHLLKPRDGDRTMKHHGIAWWVNRRLVGSWNWNSLVREGRFLDGRSSHAKKFTFIVEADPLQPDVLADWTGFGSTKRVRVAQDVVEGHIAGQLKDLLRETRSERKKRVLETAVVAMEHIPPLSREHVASFVDEVVERCPTVSEHDLSNMVEIVANLEKSRTGYTLLEQLAAIPPGDLDRLSELLDKWSVRDAKRVLDELGWRLELIQRMAALVDDPHTDELHELQPLFAVGLWIFGPEYESIEFTSNVSITEVLRRFFDKDTVPQSRRRPDFVILPDSSLGLYGHPRFSPDSREEVGLDRLVIIELKRGGFWITNKEMDQARDYCVLLRRSGKLLKDTKIEAYILGAQVDDYVPSERKEDENTILRPMAYSSLLGRAHSRTFRLLEKIKAQAGDEGRGANVLLQQRFNMAD